MLLDSTPWALFNLEPGVTRSLRVQIIANRTEIADEFIVDLPLYDHQPGDSWEVRLSPCSARAQLRRWEIRRSWLGKLLRWARHGRRRNDSRDESL